MPQNEIDEIRDRLKKSMQHNRVTVNDLAETIIKLLNHIEEKESKKKLPITPYKYAGS